MSKPLNELLEQLAAENRELAALSQEALRTEIARYLMAGGPNASWEAKDAAVAERVAKEALAAKVAALEAVKGAKDV